MDNQESEQAQAPTWRIERDADSFMNTVTNGVVEIETAQEAVIALNTLQTSLSEANAEVTRLRGALEFFVAFWDEGGNGEGWTLEEAAKRARAALAREENP